VYEFLIHKTLVQFAKLTGYAVECGSSKENVLSFFFGTKKMYYNYTTLIVAVIYVCKNDKLPLT
jgi:hypothetical protein